MYRRNGGDAKRLNFPRFAKKERRKACDRTPWRRVPPILEPLRHPAPPLQVPRGRSHAGENDDLSHVARRRRTSRRALWRPARPAAALWHDSRLQTLHTSLCATPAPACSRPSHGDPLSPSPLCPSPRGGRPQLIEAASLPESVRPDLPQPNRSVEKPRRPCHLSAEQGAREGVGAELLAAVRRARREELAARRLWRQVSAEAPDEAAVRVVRDEQPPTLGLWASISSVHPGRGRRPRGFVTARRHCGSRPTPPSRTPREGTRVAR